MKKKNKKEKKKRNNKKKKVIMKKKKKKKKKMMMMMMMTKKKNSWLYATDWRRPPEVAIFNSIWRTNRTTETGKFRESTRGNPEFK